MTSSQFLSYAQHHQLGELLALSPYLRTSPWIHAGWSRCLGRNVSRQLRLAVENGNLWKCKEEHWLCLSPQAHLILSGWVLSHSQYEKLRRGPDPHSKMVMRLWLELLKRKTRSHNSSDWCIELANFVRPESKPAAWGALSHKVPDLIVRFRSEFVTPLAIECERTIKTLKKYEHKFYASKPYRYVYVCQSLAHQERLLKIFESLGKPKIRVLLERDWNKFVSKLYSQHQRLLMREIDQETL